MKIAIRITKVRPTRKRKWKAKFAMAIFSVSGFVYRIFVAGEKAYKFLLDYFDSPS